MGQEIYLLNIKTCGIKNIENPIELNFYKKTINNDFNPEKYRIKGIYGENGSGKTAIVQSIKLLSNFIIDKNYLLDTDTQNNLYELINKRLKEGFIEVEYYVNIQELNYILRYYIAFGIKDDERVYITEEKLDVKKANYSKNKYRTIYQTRNGELVEFVDGEIFEIIKEKTLNLLDRQTFNSTLFFSKENSEMLIDRQSYHFYLLLIMCSLSTMVYIDAEDSHATYIVKKRISELDETDTCVFEKDFIKRLKNDLFKTSNDEIMIPKELFPSYQDKISRMAEFIKIFKPELETIEIETKDKDKYYKCNLKMVYLGYTLDKEYESRGIKKMMDLFDYLDAASQGAIVFIDELDANVNDVYLDKIIEYFIYYGKGQLCFTAHNLSPMSILTNNKSSINFISAVNTVHTWVKTGNLSPENAYKNGFIEDSPFNVDASDFLGILGGGDE